MFNAGFLASVVSVERIPRDDGGLPWVRAESVRTSSLRLCAVALAATLLPLLARVVATAATVKSLRRLKLGWAESPPNLSSVMAQLLVRRPSDNI